MRRPVRVKTILVFPKWFFGSEPSRLCRHPSILTHIERFFARCKSGHDQSLAVIISDVVLDLVILPVRDVGKVEIGIADPAADLVMDSGVIPGVIPGRGTNRRRLCCDRDRQ
jgi:hypothetical protein